jgi:hypothetical protein
MASTFGKHGERRSSLGPRPPNRRSCLGLEKASRQIDIAGVTDSCPGFPPAYQNLSQPRPESHG